jgi:hypothetical protein
MAKNKQSYREIIDKFSNIFFENQTTAKVQSTPITSGLYRSTIPGSFIEGTTTEVGSPEAYISALQYIQNKYRTELFSGIQDPALSSIRESELFKNAVSQGNFENLIQHVIHRQNIDFSLLPRHKSKEIFKEVEDLLLRKESIIEQIGMPSLLFPSDNPFRSQMRYRVDLTAGLKEGERNTSRFNEDSSN